MGNVLGCSVAVLLCIVYISLIALGSGSGSVLSDTPAFASALLPLLGTSRMR